MPPYFLEKKTDLQHWVMRANVSLKNTAHKLPSAYWSLVRLRGTLHELGVLSIDAVQNLFAGDWIRL